MEKTSIVKNKGNSDGHNDSSGFNTWIQIVDDDNLHTNTPGNAVVGEDTTPEVAI